MEVVQADGRLKKWLSFTMTHDHCRTAVWFRTQARRELHACA